jgi:hypothetical protein
MRRGRRPSRCRTRPRSPRRRSPPPHRSRRPCDRCSSSPCWTWRCKCTPRRCMSPRRPPPSGTRRRRSLGRAVGIPVLVVVPAVTADLGSDELDRDHAAREPRIATRDRREPCALRVSGRVAGAELDLASGRQDARRLRARVGEGAARRRQQDRRLHAAGDVDQHSVHAVRRDGALTCRDRQARRRRPRLVVFLAGGEHHQRCNHDRPRSHGVPSVWTRHIRVE